MWLMSQTLAEYMNQDSQPLLPKVIVLTVTLCAFMGVEVRETMLSQRPASRVLESVKGACERKRAWPSPSMCVWEDPTDQTQTLYYYTNRTGAHADG